MVCSLPERRATSVRRVARKADVRSSGVGSRPMMNKAELATVHAQCMPHAVHIAASTVGEVPVIRPLHTVGGAHPGQVSASLGHHAGWCPFSAVLTEQPPGSPRPPRRPPLG
jgi:hypothetical protein